MSKGSGERDPAVSQKSTVLGCAACGRSFLVRDYLPALKYSCPLCSAALPPLSVADTAVIGAGNAEPKAPKPASLVETGAMQPAQTEKAAEGKPTPDPAAETWEGRHDEVPEAAGEKSAAGAKATAEAQPAGAPARPAGGDGQAGPHMWLGRYKLVDKAGSGGMGVVYRAWDDALRRHVAVKIVTGDATKEILKRFRHEVELSARLEHPHIAPVYDLGDADGHPYVVMKFIDGKTLDQVFPQPPEGLRGIMKAAALIRDACRGVGHAHKSGVVHRDLKPRNIMVDQEGWVHVLDFGLAKSLDRRGDDVALTTVNTIFGSPAFMSPEQARGLAAEIDTRSDVYSLGSTLWTLLTGQYTHDATSTQEMLIKVATEPVKRLGEVRPDVPEALDAVVARATAHAKAERFTNATELGIALERFLENAAAPPPGLASAAGVSPVLLAPEARNRVLLVDDDQTVAFLVKHLLGKEGFEVLYFEDPLVALTAAGDTPVALAILDGQMPGLDGFELLGKLRRIPSYARIPIIMLTGLKGEKDVLRGFELGADDYVGKPFNPPELLARVKRLLRRPR